MALAAGVIHLAQVGPHLTESWAFAAFFLIVGTVQVVAAGFLLRTWPAGWFRFGILGSAAVIGIWVLSRTVGLPFGPEPGGAEELGAADAAASLAEAITVVVLGLWIWEASGARSRVGAVAAAMAIAGLGALWAAGRVSGIFDPDAGVTIGLPQLIDRAAFAVVAGVAVMLASLATSPAARPRWWAPLMRGLLAAIVVASVALTGLTLPAAGGQNPSCTYAPLAERSLVSHAAVAAAPLTVGEERWFGVVVLAACAPGAVQIDTAEVLNARGPGSALDFALLAINQRLPDAGAESLPGGTQTLAAAPVLQPGDERQLAVLLRGGNGVFNLDSVRIGYQLAGEPGSVAFATILSTCPPWNCADE